MRRDQTQLNQTTTRDAHCGHHNEHLKIIVINFLNLTVSKEKEIKTNKTNEAGNCFITEFQGNNNYIVNKYKIMSGLFIDFFYIMHSPSGFEHI